MFFKRNKKTADTNTTKPEEKPIPKPVNSVWYKLIESFQKDEWAFGEDSYDEHKIFTQSMKRVKDGLEVEVIRFNILPVMEERENLKVKFGLV